MEKLQTGHHKFGDIRSKVESTRGSRAKYPFHDVIFFYRNEEFCPFPTKVIPKFEQLLFSEAIENVHHFQDRSAQKFILLAL